jgi:hypothetical protein
VVAVTADLDRLVEEIEALPREQKLQLVERLEQDGFFNDDRSDWTPERKKTGGGVSEDNHGRFSTTPPGSNGRSLLRFAGTINENDLIAIQRAIEEGCEVVDQEGW